MLVRTSGDKSKPAGTLSWCGTASVECLKQWWVWGRPCPLSWSCHAAIEVTGEEWTLAGHESDMFCCLCLRLGETWSSQQDCRHFTEPLYPTIFPIFWFVWLVFSPKNNCFQTLVICFCRNCKVEASSVKIYILKYFIFLFIFKLFYKKII